jgi:hypothetical protein
MVRPILHCVAMSVFVAVSASCGSANATGPSKVDGPYQGSIRIVTAAVNCLPVGAIHYRCDGIVRLGFNPAIKGGVGLFVDVDSSSLNNGFYDNGPYVTPTTCERPPCNWSELTVRIRGDITYCPPQRQVHVNVADAQTGRAMVNGIPTNFTGRCG